MLHLRGSQMLQTLENSLRKCLPESLKVYGTVFHMNQGNPFNLKALVDKWPDFNTVLIRPQEQEMTDDLDPHTNTYQIYSKDPRNCLECIGKPDAINWKQHLHIQSSQSNLHEVIMGLAAAKLVKVKRTQCVLYMIPQTAKKLVPFLMAGTEKLDHKSGRPRAINEEMFKLSSLDVAHAALVDKFWQFGGNEKSQRFIGRCIQIFPSLCLLGPEGTPVSWALMDQTGEIRMAGTVPDYRAQGLISHIIYSQSLVMHERGYPVYNHTERANKLMQKMSHTLHHVPMPCNWNQWNCEPLNPDVERKVVLGTP
ncbi:glycine N-acyltransferase-like protein isoform X2 [Psammomys obesus]|nr:glycine N-acyltransferase-like protein isoform X2 [Psammomys obesus]XP_055469937.1 glycine N-acyltransferase-like protein isoform X2 [Psammomys obesus]